MQKYLDSILMWQKVSMLVPWREGNPLTPKAQQSRNKQHWPVLWTKEFCPKSEAHRSLIRLRPSILTTTLEFSHTTLRFLVCIQPYTSCVVDSIQPWKIWCETNMVVLEFFELNSNHNGKSFQRSIGIASPI